MTAKRATSASASVVAARRTRCHAGALAMLVFLGACGGVAPLSAQDEPRLLDKNRGAFPAAPRSGTGALAGPVRDALADIAPALRQQRFPTDAVRTIGSSGDPRLLWYLYDLLRLTSSDSLPVVVQAFETLSGSSLASEPLTTMGDRILAWDPQATPLVKSLRYRIVCSPMVPKVYTYQTPQFGIGCPKSEQPHSGRSSVWSASGLRMH